MKKWTALFLILALALVAMPWSTLAEERAREGNLYLTGLPIVEEPITLKAAMVRGVNAGPIAEMDLLKQLSEDSNVQVKWIEFPESSLAEKRNIMFASGDFPDFALSIGITDLQYMQYGGMGLIAPLNDLIEGYAPNWKGVFESNPYARQVCTAPDGNLYSLPFIREDFAYSGIRDALVINQHWLDALGLAMPTSLAEFKDVLVAFKTGDPNGNGIADEIPWTFIYNAYKNGQFDLYSAFGLLYGAYSVDPNIVVEDGKVIYGGIEPEIKEIIAFLHDLYQAGLIDPESFTQNGSQFQAKIKADPDIVGVLSTYGAVSGVDGSKTQYVPILPFAMPDGSPAKWRQQTNAVTRGRFTLFANNPYPEATIRWIDQFADPVISLQGQYGLIGTHILEDGKGGYVIDDAVYESRQAVVPGNTAPFVLTEKIIGQVALSSTELIRSNYAHAYVDAVAPLEEIYPPVFMTQEQLEKLARYSTDLMTYVEETHAKWIVEGGVEAEWDAFVNKVNGMNVAEVVAVYQEALDAFQ